MIDYDSELRLLHQTFRGAWDVRPGDRVLDIGCGAGQSTRDVSLMAKDGTIIGIDSSQDALTRARQLTRDAGLGNVDYVCGDAARHPFPLASFDVAISRFGTMFFADPVAAFTNIGDALRQTGRLIMMVWQPADQNAWAVLIHRALVGDDSASPEAAFGAAFSLGDERTVATILQATAFTDVAVEEVNEPVYYGPDVESALRFVSRFSNVADALESQTVVERQRTLERLHNLLAAHQRNDGVWFDARAWIVRGRRAIRSSGVDSPRGQRSAS